MPRPAYPLTATVQNQICACVLAGGERHAAAEAAGIPRPVFEEWLRRGRRRGGGRRCRELLRAVRQAEATARLAAEMKTFKGQPLDWLKSGPGGWGRAAAEPRAVEPLLVPVLRAFLARLLEALAPYPDARRAVARLVEEQPGLLHVPDPE
jgi:hypothetical protein